MNYKKYYLKILKYMNILLLSPFIIIIILIYPIIKIKIFQLETRRIGHLGLPYEIFASELKAKIHNDKRTIYLWYPNKLITNKFLFKKWKEIFIVLPRAILEPIFLFFNHKKIKFGKSFLIPFRCWSKIPQLDIDKSYEDWQDKDIHNILKKTKPNIIFSKDEIIKGNNYLSKFNITNENSYVVFFFRNPAYYFENKLMSSYKVNLRDQLKFDYCSSVDYLSSKNYKVFLLGHNYEIEKKSKNLIYYNQSRDKNDFLDIFLPFHCKFMVSSASGISNIPQLNRRKTLIINFSELYALNHIDSYYTPIVLPKKFRSIKSGKVLTYSEVFDLKLSEYMFEDDLKKEGFETIENSESEIFDAVQEMEDFIKNDQTLNYNLNDTQNKFNELYFSKFNYKMKYSKISNSFLEKNKDLFL